MDSLNRVLRRIVPSLVLLLVLVFILDACTTRRRGSSSDDDDAAANDDDSAVSDDDDASSDDDDVSDDDDASGDDDDASGDDDDSMAPGVLILSADLASLGNVAPGGQATTNLYFENAGGTAVQAQISLSDLSGTWQVAGSVVNIAPATTETRTLTFNAPAQSGTYTLTLNAEHDGSNPSPQQLVFTANSGDGGPTTETSCTDNIDNDNDGNTDCADTDCANDPACQNDPCCQEIPGSYNPSDCFNQSVNACICTNDPVCCTNWDSTCAGYYEDGWDNHGSTVCSDSGTCGP